MASGRSNSTTVQKADPWTAAQPLLKDIMGHAQSLYGSGQGNRYFPGSTVAPQSVFTNLAQNLVAERALRGSALTDQAKAAFAGLLNAAPHRGTNALADNVASAVMPRVNATFSGAGRTGSGLHRDTAVRAMTQAFAPFAQSQMNADQDRLMKAATLAPAIAAGDYANLSQLANVGAEQDRFRQRQLSDDVSRHYYNQNAPFEALQRYNAIVQGHAGLGGATTQTSSMPGQSPVARALGGATAGLSLASLSPALGPFGIPLAIGGGLLGLFG